MDPFVRDVEYYVRDYDLYNTYINDSALHLSLMEGIPLEDAKRFMLQLTGPEGAHPIKAPKARYLHRNKVGDREKREMPLDEFWQMVRDNRQILSPSQTAYLHPDQLKSILAIFISGNLAKRNKAKGEQLAAERAGDMALKAIKNSAQTTFKIKNNALSGAHSSPYTILWNKSSHSTLTSGCRVATSYGNANNEKFLYGNRHYWSPIITKNNLISIVTHSNFELINDVMVKYELRHPTVDEVMGMIERSSNSYWRGEELMAPIRKLVERFSDIERSAVMFTGDLYHLSNVNPGFVRKFLSEMATRTDVPLSPEECDEWVKKMDGDLIAFVSMLCPDCLFNPETEKYEALKDVKRPEARGILIANGKRIYNTQMYYADIIRAFWTTDNLPSSINYLPNIIRRGVITSDTDSTIFSVSRWPIWFYDSEDITKESMAISSTMIYLTSKIIIHILAKFSANCGVAQQDIFRLAMKNEFFMPVFGQTSRAKHYCAFVTMQEGTMKKEMEFDVKGVAMRSSNVPPEIMAQSHDLMRAIMTKVTEGKKISLRSVLRRVALIENEIRQSVTTGNYRYLKRMNINERKAYKAENGGNYRHYEFWESVFSAKYGTAPEPPYRAIKISLDIKNKTQMRAWIDSIEDRAIAKNLETWVLEKSSNGTIGSLLLPELNLQATGVPKEIIPVIDIRNLISQTMESFYLVLEQIGYYCRDKNITRLLSDNEWLLDPNNPIEPFEI